MGRIALFLTLLLLPLAAAVAHPSAAEKIGILSKRVEAEPENPLHLVARGAAYSHEGDYDLALADLRKAEQLGGALLVAYEFGVLERRRGNFVAARAYLESFLERAPNHAPALEQLAHVLGDLGESREAVATFERLFAANPNPITVAARPQWRGRPGDRSGSSR